MEVGSLFLGVVGDIYPNHITIHLPNCMFGTLSKSNTYVSENGVPAPIGDIALSKRFSIGRMVTVVVVDHERNKRPALSMDPFIINAGLNFNNITARMTLSCFVKTLEDHGIMVDFGVKSGKRPITGFLPHKNVNGEPSDPAYLEGSIISVSITKVDKATSTIVCSALPLTEDSKPLGFNADCDITALKPGFYVQCRTTEVVGIMPIVANANANRQTEKLLPHSEGAIYNRTTDVRCFDVTFLSCLHGHIPKSHILYPVEYFGTNDSTVNDTYKKGYHKYRKEFEDLRSSKKLRCRIIAIKPSTDNNNKDVMLSMLPHIVDFKGYLPDVGMSKQGFTISQAVVFDVAPKHGMRIMGFSGKSCIVGFCSLSNVSDKNITKVDDVLATNQKCRARVLTVNFLEGCAVVSTKESILKEPLLSAQDVKVGSIIHAEVAAVFPWGLLVSIGKYLKGRVDTKQLADSPPETVPDSISAGAKGKYRVLSIDPEHGSVSLSAKKSFLSDKNRLTCISPGSIQPNCVFKGFVFTVKNSRASATDNTSSTVVRFYNNIGTILSAEEINYAKELRLSLKDGVVVTVRVTRVDYATKRIGVSFNLHTDNSHCQFSYNPLKRKPVTDVDDHADEFSHAIDNEGDSSSVVVVDNIMQLLRVCTSEKSAQDPVPCGTIVMAHVVAVASNGVFVWFTSAHFSKDATKPPKKGKSKRKASNVDDSDKDCDEYSNPEKSVEGKLGFLSKEHLGDDSSQCHGMFKNIKCGMSLRRCVVIGDTNSRVFVGDLQATYEAADPDNELSKMLSDHQLKSIQSIPTNADLSHAKKNLFHELSGIEILSSKESLASAVTSDSFVVSRDKVPLLAGSTVVAYITRILPNGSGFLVALGQMDITGLAPYKLIPKRLLNNDKDNKLFVGATVHGRVAAFRLIEETKRNVETKKLNFLFDLRESESDAVMDFTGTNASGVRSDQTSMAEQTRSLYPLGSILKAEFIGTVPQTKGGNRKYVNFRLSSSPPMYCRVHVTELRDECVNDPLSSLKLHDGQSVDIKIIEQPKNYNPFSNSRICLEGTMRLCEVLSSTSGNREYGSRHTLKMDSIKMGNRYDGYVISSGGVGVFIAVSIHVCIRIQLKEVSYSPKTYDEIRQMFPFGKYVDAVEVIDVNYDTERIEGSIKRVKESKDTRVYVPIQDVVARNRNKALNSELQHPDAEDSEKEEEEQDEQEDEDDETVDDTGDGIKEKYINAMSEDDIKQDMNAVHDLEGEDEEDIATVNDSEKEAEEGISEINDSEPSTTTSNADIFETTMTMEELDHTKSTDSVWEWDDAIFSRKKNVTNSTVLPERLHEKAFSAEPNNIRNGSRKRSIAEIEQGGTEDGVDEEDKKAAKKNKRQKMAEKKAYEIQIREIEASALNGSENAQSSEDFERLLFPKGNIAQTWIRYMQFHASLGEMDKARNVAERGVKHSNLKTDKERLKVWLFYLSLECSAARMSAEYGNANDKGNTKVEHLLKRAMQYNDEKIIYMQMTYIYENGNMPSDAMALSKKACVKFPQSKKMWIRQFELLYTLDDSNDHASTEETVQELLAVPLQKLPKRKHVALIAAIARFEYKAGNIERGQTYFERLISEYPGRCDIWSQYFDAHISAIMNEKNGGSSKQNIRTVRSLFERRSTLGLKPRKMKFFFTRWLAFERQFGTQESQVHVQEKAREYVEFISGT